MSPEFREVPSHWTLAGGGLLCSTLVVHELVLSRLRTRRVISNAGRGGRSPSTSHAIASRPARVMPSSLPEWGTSPLELGMLRLVRTIHGEENTMCRLPNSGDVQAPPAIAIVLGPGPDTLSLSKVDGAAASDVVIAALPLTII
eukprot:scaffold7629_cov36-Tisochrysis_lutea.AAC.1